MSKTSLRDLRGNPVSIQEDEDYRRAKGMRQVFQDAPASFGAYPVIDRWPTSFYEIGKGKSLAYTSNKWKRNERDFEDYKHVAEGPQQVFVHERFLREGRLDDLPHRERPMTKALPGVLAELAPALFVEIQPYDSLPARGEGRLAKEAFRLSVAKPMVMFGGFARPPGTGSDWKGKGTPFLVFVCEKTPIIMIVGDELGVGKDGVFGLLDTAPRSCYRTDMKRSDPTILIPLLSAMYWGSCYSPYGSKLPQNERDVRSFVCALCLSLTVYIFAKVIVPHLPK